MHEYSAKVFRCLEPLAVERCTPTANLHPPARTEGRARPLEGRSAPNGTGYNARTARRVGGGPSTQTFRNTLQTDEANRLVRLCARNFQRGIAALLLAVGLPGALLQEPPSGLVRDGFSYPIRTGVPFTDGHTSVNRLPVPVLIGRRSLGESGLMHQSLVR